MVQHSVSCSGHLALNWNESSRGRSFQDRCCCRLSCCVAGNCDLEVQETHVKETLELVGERLDHPQPQALYPPFVPLTHPLSYVETALRSVLLYLARASHLCWL